MSGQRIRTVKSLPQPETDDHAAWSEYWHAIGQPWRTEPLISSERQAELEERRKVRPKAAARRFPFSGMRLSRADVEWLLATHQSGRKPIDPDDLSQRRRHGIDLRMADVSGVDLSGLSLIHLWGAADRSFLSSRREHAARMRSTRLVGADLRGATLCWVDFIGANLTGADLREADIRTANFSDAILVGAKLEGSYPWLGVKFIRADLSGAHLGRLSFDWADLDGANLKQVDGERTVFRYASLRQARLAHAHLRTSQFIHVKLDGADLTSTDLSYARFYDVLLEGACLKDVRLTGAVMTPAVASGFQGADLSQVQIVEESEAAGWR